MTGCGPHCGHHKDMVELEQLRALIVDWVNADLRYWDADIETDKAVTNFAAACQALRKAVGR